MTSTVRRLWLACGVLVSAVAAAAPAPLITAPQVDTPTRVLFVGNSYLYYGDSLHNHVRRMVLAAVPRFRKQDLKYKSATIGGARLAHHDINYLTTPGRIGVREPFQLVILQGGSAAPLSEARREQFREKVIEFSRVISSRGGKTALYLPHVYVPPHPRAAPENIRLTEDLYVSVANEVGALVIPVGLAFEEAYHRRPQLRLHKAYDGSHPDLPGTYLAACTVFASVYGISPVGNSYDYFGAIDRETASFLQQVAWDTVTKFFGRQQAPAG
ncbi:MAG: hypothetical protein LJE84_10280 [Gammaproteobacteria bacterium]|nr:hypothetical protein [Gammaproteobacteria bacterium]